MKLNRAAIGIVIVGAVLFPVLACCSNRDIAIVSTDVEPNWPFTVPEVTVVCAPALAIFIRADGRAYPLNGQAERHPDLYKDGSLGKLNDIWKVDLQMSKLSPDARMSLDTFTQKAIEACVKAGKWDLSKD